MSPHDAERMTTRYQLLFVAVERAINEADPIGLLELGAPSSEYAGEIGTIVPGLPSVKRLDDITGVLHEEFIRWFGAGTAAHMRTRRRRVGSGTRLWSIDRI